MRAVLIKRLCYEVVSHAPGRSVEYAVAGAVRGPEQDRIARTVCCTGMGVSSVLGALGACTTAAAL